MNDPGRQLWAALELLDRQILDKDGLMSGKVDDLEFDLPSQPADLPVLARLLVGRGAWSRRIGGRLGRWLHRVQDRLRVTDQLGEVPIEAVKTIGSHLELTIASGDLAVAAWEDWVRTKVIERIPGSAGSPRGTEEHRS